MALPPTSPWTPAEIRHRASSWSLEADAKLLDFMKGISDELDRRASDTTDRLHRLRLNVDRTDVALENVTNQLSALQHSQFVENRVYEDDETIANVSEVPTGDEVDEKSNYDPVDTLKKLLDTSMDVLNRCYEKVSIDIQDSDEEDDSPKSVIYRPKDPFANRPLPHIIGSKEWMQKWHVGLYDSDDDLSGDEQKEDFSESSESASMSASLPSSAPAMSESELSAWGFQQNASEHLKRRVDLYVSSEEDISGEIKQSLNDNRYGSKTMPYNNAPYQEPESQYYIHQPKRGDAALFDDSSSGSTDSELYNIKSTSERTVPIPPMQKVNQISNIFSDEPPPDLDVVDRQQRPDVDLFCESEGEEKKPRQSSTVAKQQETQNSYVRKKTVNLFDDDDFDSFMKELNTRTQQKADLPNKAVKNLFEESSDEEIPDDSKKSNHRPSEEAYVKPSASVPESISTDTVEIKIESNSTLAKALKTEDIFADSDISKAPSDLKNVSASTDLFNSNTKTKLFDDTYQYEHDDFPSTQQQPTRKKTIITNLFNDEPPDDDFDSLFKSDASSGTNLTKPTSPKIVVNKMLKKGLFDDSDDDEICDTTVGDKMHVSGDNSLEKKIGVVDGTLTPADLFEDKTTRGDPIFVPEKTQPISETANLFDDKTHEEPSELFGGEPKLLVGKNNDYQPQNDELVSSIQPVSQQNDISFAAIRKRSDTERYQISDKKIGDLKFQPSPSRSTEVEKTEESHLKNDQVFPKDAESGNLERSEQEQDTFLGDSESLINDIPVNTQQSKMDLDNVFDSANADVITSGCPADLFSDVPPDDDDISMTKSMESGEDVFDRKSEEKYLSPNEFSVASVQTSTGHNVEISSESASTSQIYNSFSFFDDTPPDDDFEATPQYGKKLHSIFYDDFSETIVPSQIDSKPKSLSSFIFSEPPPDTKESVSCSSSESKLQKIEDIAPESYDSEKKVASAIERTHKNAPEASQDSQPVKMQPPPRKLNSKLNINVAALLPGAKRPSMKSMQVTKTIDEIRSDAATEPSSTKPVLSTSPQTTFSESDPKMLQNLNKSRAKIQVKRRPSTRKARKEHYRQSLKEKQNDDIGEVSPVSKQKSENSSNFMNKEVNLESTTKSSESNATFVTASNNVNIFAEVSTARKQDIPVEAPKQGLSEKDARATPESNMAVRPSGIFSESSPPIDSYQQALKSDSTAKTPDLFFDDRCDRDDDDDFLPPIPKVVPKPSVSISTSKPEQGEQQSFGQSLGQVKKLTPSLFDDESDDDLFGSGSKIESEIRVSSVNQKKIPTSLTSAESRVQAPKTSYGERTIFGSDDNDDDLFGSATASKIEPASKISSIKTDSWKSKAKNQSSLFDDNDDDDDDLFGGTATKHETAVPMPKKSDATSKKPIISTEVLTTNKNFDDPLADLFKDT